MGLTVSGWLLWVLIVAGLLALAFSWQYALTRPRAWRAWPVVFATAAGVFATVLLTGQRWCALAPAAISAGIAVRDVWPILTHRHDTRLDHYPFRRLP